MSFQDMGSLGEFIAAIATVATLLYLSAQIRQTNLITKAQFGHGLTHRLYERFFQTAKDPEFAEFIGKDWAGEDINSVDKSRITFFTIMLLVDVFERCLMSSDDIFERYLILSMSLIDVLMQSVDA